jgi:hypothetical protein
MRPHSWRRGGTQAAAYCARKGARCQSRDAEEPPCGGCEHPQTTPHGCEDAGGATAVDRQPVVTSPKALLNVDATVTGALHAYAITHTGFIGAMQAISDIDRV